MFLSRPLRRTCCIVGAVFDKSRPSISKISARILTQSIFPNCLSDNSFLLMCDNSGLIKQQRREFSSSPSSAGKVEMKVNEKITAAEMRVIYVEKDANGEEVNKWKILDREGALQLARSMRLDLILINENSRPPVCKIDNFKEMQAAQRKKDKEAKKKEKEKVFEIKEMQFNVGIDNHDFETKMNRVKDFLGLGHPVRVVLTFKRTKNVEKMTLDELSLKVLDSLDGYVTSVTQKGDEFGKRKDLVFSPKKHTKDTVKPPVANSSSNSNNSSSNTNSISNTSSNSSNTNSNSSNKAVVSLAVKSTSTQQSARSANPNSAPTSSPPNSKSSAPPSNSVKSASASSSSISSAANQKTKL